MIRIIIILLIASFRLEAQIINDSLLSSFYNKTLSEYFSDTIYNKPQKQFKWTIVRTDFNSSKLIKQVKGHRLRFYYEDIGYSSLLAKPLSKNKERNIYNITCNQLGKDTFDILIGGKTLVNISKNSETIATWCGGTVGYAPDGRFIFNHQENRWIFISHAEVVEQNMKKLLERK